MTGPDKNAFWATSATELFPQIRSNLAGLSQAEAAIRQSELRGAHLQPKRKRAAVTLWLAQFKSPIILILLAAAGLSLFLRDQADAAIILVIVFVSGSLGFWQEHRAADAVERLLAIVKVKAMVRRDGVEFEIPVEEVVPGEIVILNAGDVVPGDGLIVESKGLFVDEAALTGETYPAEKSAGLIAPEASIGQRTNCVWMGTHVVSGTATIVIVHTGPETEFGKVSQRLKLRPPETEFEHGVRWFGYFLIELTLLLVIAIFAINVYLHRPVLDSFLFALALAVGLTPQLLPAVISVNLAHGAERMAALRVIVKRLASIENFGSMTVLCSDKTGTLTEGAVTLDGAIAIDGSASSKVLEYAALNARFQTGYTNPMDEAILRGSSIETGEWQKLDEEPYDFARRRMSVLLRHGTEQIMITKGALKGVLAACSFAETARGSLEEISAVRDELENKFQEFCQKGLRVLGLASRRISRASIGKEDEMAMTFLGFLLFSDPLRAGITERLTRLRELGITLKLITGDHHLVAAEVSRQAGIVNPQVVTGGELHTMSETALIKRVNEVDVFAEVEPNQKERIILALRKSGQVVGYLGDGINDASALHAADVGISVSNAVDVAKEAADIVLLEKDLAVLEGGVREGRVTFANTLKYVFMATSANFGNMFSMAGASLFLPFLPLLPKQILLLNLLTDLPEMAIATDRVDSDWTDHPRRWDMKFIRKFMVTFGLISSVFDYLMFGVLLLLLPSTAERFRTAWFVESVISATLIVLVIRTRKPFFQSMPGRALMFATIIVVVAAIALPVTPLGKVFGFIPLNPAVIGAIAAIVGLYMIAAEIAKRQFYRRVKI